VVAQNPPADTKDASSPKIGLLFSAADNAQQYVMPSFIGKSLPQATAVLEEAGFSVGKVHAVNAPTADIGDAGSSASGTIVHQTPAPGHKISAGAAIDFDVAK
jgi:beta-lactam-binding protein with PASTA domain